MATETKKGGGVLTHESKMIVKPIRFDFAFELSFTGTQ